MQNNRMCKEDESWHLSQNGAQMETVQVKIELPPEACIRLTQLSASTGIPLEQLVAQAVSKLIGN